MKLKIGIITATKTMNAIYAADQQMRQICDITYLPYSTTMELANIYLDKFDKEFESRGVKVIRYADDILLMAKSIRAAERLLETSTRYLEKKMKLKVNTEKSRAVSVYSIRNFGFSALRWEGTEREHTSEFTKSRKRKPKKSSGS